MYVPASIWPQLKEKIAAIHKDVKLGDVSGIAVLLECESGADLVRGQLVR